MLPDFPGFKKELQLNVVEKLVARARERSGLLPMLPAMIIFEGEAWKVTTEEPSPFHELSTRMTVHDSESADFTFEDSCKFLANGIEDLTRKMVEEATEMIQEAIKDGHRGFGMSQNITEDGLLELFERLEVNFTPNGDLAPGLLANPTVARKIEEFLKLPSFQQRWVELLNKKAVEFNDRESLRKLVG